jgi:hypothetical protein
VRPLSRVSGDVGGVVSAEGTGSEDMVAWKSQAAEGFSLVAADEYVRISIFFNPNRQET